MESKKSVEELTLWLAEVLVNPFLQREKDLDLKIQEAILCLSIAELFEPYSRNTLYGKMFVEHFQATEEKTFLPSSGKWLNSGIVCAGECWMHNTLASPKEGVACSLSEVLEKTPVPSTYYLSPQAAKGILSRAESVGKEIPPKLKEALENMITNHTEL